MRGKTRLQDSGPIVVCRRNLPIRISPAQAVLCIEGSPSTKPSPAQIVSYIEESPSTLNLFEHRFVLCIEGSPPILPISIFLFFMYFFYFLFFFGAGLALLPVALEPAAFLADFLAVWGATPASEAGRFLFFDEEAFETSSALSDRCQQIMSLSCLLHQKNKEWTGKYLRFFHPLLFFLVVFLRPKTYVSMHI